jgi:hypothetical protein
MPYSPQPTTGGQDLRPNAYSSAGGDVMGQQVISQFDLYKPNKFVQVFHRHCQHISFRIMLRAMGFSRGTAAPTTGHYEYPWIKNLVTVGSIVTASTGPGSQVVFELDAADMFDAQVSVGGVALQASYPVEKEEMLLPGDALAVIVEKDTSVTPHRLTVLPKDGNLDLATLILPNQAYAISSNTHAEGSGLPAGRTPRIIDYTNTFQIIKTKSSVSGSEATNEMYFEPLEGQPGSFILKGDWDAMHRFEDAVDGALVFGTQNTNPLLVDQDTDMGYDVPYTGTEGLVPFAVNEGNVDTYNVFSINDFDDVSAYYEGERIGVRELITLCGMQLYIEQENVLQNFLNADVNSQLWYDWLNPSDWVDDYQPNDAMKDQYLHIGFKGLNKAGYTYGIRLLHVFNENVGAGASIYNYQRRQLIIPKGYSKDKRSGESRPTMGYEYKQLGQYSREYIYGMIGGAGITEVMPSNQFDTRKKFHISEVSFHGTCSNHVTIQQPQ